jgi:general secretion pathway protein L
MSALIVFLPPQAINATTEFDFAVTNDGATVTNHGAAHASVLPMPLRAGSEIVAVVPANMLSWHRTELPQGTSARSPRLRAVLEGLLEDHLLDEPEALHFAVQPQARSGAPLWVATCDRGWLRAAIQVLESAGRPAARIVPEFAPEGTPRLYAVGDPQHPQLIVAGADGVAVLPLSSQSLSLLPALPDDTPCIAEPAVAAMAEQVLQHQPVLQHPSERWLQAAQSSWDLAQFDFSSSGRARAFKKLGTAWGDLLSAPQWRPARWGALLLVAVNLIGLNAWAWHERSVQNEKRDAIRAALTQTFPQVKVVVDAPVQMEREVSALRQVTGATSQRDLEAMLGALSAAAPAQRPVSAVDYASGELRVKGLALTPDETRSLTGALKAQGYSAAVNGETLVITAEVQP